MTTKYYYHAESDKLFVVELENGEAQSIAVLEDPFTVEDEVEEEDEEEPEPVRHTPKGEAKPCCGSKGPRHLKNCPLKKEANERNRDKDPFVSMMVEMLEEGSTDTDIYNAMHDRLTDAQFREKLEEAKRTFQAQ